MMSYATPTQIKFSLQKKAKAPEMFVANFSCICHASFLCSLMVPVKKKEKCSFSNIFSMV